MAKGRMTMDPRLFKLMGKGLYRMSPLNIVPRELLQNSCDACDRAGRTPDITIKYETDVSEDGIWITCTDNGCGMDLDDLLNKFLCMGGTTKANDPTMRGKFGIAKAVLMCQDYWSCHTHNLWVDSKIVLEDGDIREDMPYLDGCEIRVYIKRYIYATDVFRSVSFIDNSDVNVHVITKGRNRDEFYNDWNIDAQRGLGAKSIDRTLLNTLDEIDCDVYGSMRKAVDRYEFYRLNGLVQYMIQTNKDRAIDLFFDFRGTKTLDDDDYPFTMSRESLQSKASEICRKISIAHEAEQTQSILSVTQPKQSPDLKEKVVKGRWLKGTRRFRDYGSDIERMEEVQFAFAQTAISMAQSFKTEVINGADPSLPSFYLTRYKGSRETAHRHTNLMFAFGAVLELVAPESERFGVGLTNDPTALAAKLSYQSDTFYVLNPDGVDEKSSPKAQVLQLWELATHEVTHIDHYNHNEAFMLAQGQLRRDTSDEILANIDRIAKMITK